MASASCRPRIVIDMRQVTFMDSSGINIFIATHRTASEAGGWLRLAAPGEAVKRTLSLVGVDAVIDCQYGCSSVLLTVEGSLLDHLSTTLQEYQDGVVRRSGKQLPDQDLADPHTLSLAGAVCRPRVPGP
ncbi:STAS domain-containing protein [Streptomyces sp. WG7]|uniref:STAS domain-containing protein n=1 Tax=Streptomyces sp. WG7 TaxID=3417650 RepID=UPI003CFB9AEF